MLVRSASGWWSSGRSSAARWNSLVDHHVPRLEVAVHDASLVRRVLYAESMLRIRREGTERA